MAFLVFMILLIFILLYFLLRIYKFLKKKLIKKFFYEPGINEEKFKSLISDKSIDIIVFGIRGFPGAIKNPEMYGWIEDQENIIKKVHVKKKYKDPKLDPIIIGTFFFKKGEIFK